VKKVDSSVDPSVRHFASFLSPALFLSDEMIHAAKEFFFPDASKKLAAELISNPTYIEASKSSLITFRVQKLRELRTELASESDKLRKALQFLAEYRKKQNLDGEMCIPALKAEKFPLKNFSLLFLGEQLIADSLKGNINSMNDSISKFMEILKEDYQNVELARWVGDIIDGLPSESRKVCKELWMAVVLRLGIVPSGFGSEYFHLLPKDEEIGICLKKNGLLKISFLPQEGDEKILVPGMNIRHLKINLIRGGDTVSFLIWPKNDEEKVGYVEFSSECLPMRICTLADVCYEVGCENGKLAVKRI
jgi:hypothetical protein